MKSPSLEQQRGAVSLIGAIFLIVSVMVLLTAVQRMAGTSVTDSALHSDGIQALFIAESGLERAAWRYDSGTACAALSGESGNIGPGSFTILSGSVVGAVCRIRVIGSVTTTIAANTVNRIIDGELTASSTGSGGGGSWATGRRDRGPLLINYDGNNWSRSGSTAGIPSRNLFDITCAAANDCWAVGDDDRGELIVHWDGSDWSRIGPYPSIADRGLYSVTCVSSNDCWAVGDSRNGEELIIHWDGSSWTQVARPNYGIPYTDLYGVHCVDSDDCWAVGQEFYGELIIHWDGNVWSRVSPYWSFSGRSLYSVHCISSDDCWAVGAGGGGDLFMHWDGNNWSRRGPYSAVANQILDSVHCSSSTDCWAVGRRSGYENINYWNGITWRRINNVPSIANEHLYHVHMVNANEGYIVGARGTTAIWDGSAWTGQTAITRRDLFSVTGYGGTNDVVELVRWSEVIQ